MPKVICTLPNAGEFVNGVRFITHAEGMVSEDISEEQARRFASISGYKLQERLDGEVTPPADPAQVLRQLIQLCGHGPFHRGPTEADLEEFVAKMKAKYLISDGPGSRGRSSGKSKPTEAPAAATPSNPTPPATAAAPSGGASAPAASNDLL